MPSGPGTHTHKHRHTLKIQPIQSGQSRCDNHTLLTAVLPSDPWLRIPITPTPCCRRLNFPSTGDQLFCHLYQVYSGVCDKASRNRRGVCYQSPIPEWGSSGGQRQEVAVSWYKFAAAWYSKSLRGLCSPDTRAASTPASDTAPQGKCIDCSHPWINTTAPLSLYRSSGTQQSLESNNQMCCPT